MYSRDTWYSCVRGDNMTLGERIRKLREEKLLSQTELAKMVGITKQSLYKYESSIITNIPSSKIESIAQKLETTPAYLMGWEDNKEDAFSSILFKLRSDKKFLDICSKLSELSSDQLEAVQTMLSAFK